MTREEAKRILYVYRAMNLVDGSHREAFDMAIKALEQEDCEDCISRESVLAIAGDSCLDLNSYEDTKEFCDEIKDLPPVTPQPKTDVLDKIRAEIMQLDYDTDYVDYDHNDMAQTETIHTICREEVIQIIDKYKTGEE